MADTIVALSSGTLPAGIAVLRISGPAVLNLLESFAGRVPEPRHAAYCAIRSPQGDVLDRGLVLFFPGPRSVTGEDLAELHLHGGRAVVAATLEALTSEPDVRLAEAGEFTRRAFENGRIDLTEAEGLADLLAAETEGQRRQAVTQASGALRDLYEGWMRRLTHARAMIEADFDFADEGDVSEDVAADVLPEVETLRTEMTAHLGSARRGEILRDGFHVAIVGAPNAGKSSLLNALAERDVAIVSDIPGTTRDVIEVRLDLRGIPVRLSDTAGLRETTDRIEAIGVERARAVIALADLVLHLVDPGESEAAMFHVEHGATPVLRVHTKSDRYGGETGQDGVSRISVRSGEGLPELIERIAEIAADAAGDPNAVVPARLRHREIVSDALAILATYDPVHQPPEIAAETLRRASDRLGALTGRVGVEDLLDVIFSEFCIGK